MLYLHHKQQFLITVQEEITLYPENHKKHISTICGQIQSLNALVSRSYSNHCISKGLYIIHWAVRHLALLRLSIVTGILKILFIINMTPYLY